MDMPRREMLIEWADARLEEAERAANNGNLIPMNALGKNPVFEYYMNNVYFVPAMSRKTFIAIENYMKEFDRLYEAEQREIQRDNDLKEATEKNAAFEQRLAEQAAQIEELMAYFREAQAKNGKPAKKPKAEPAAEVEPQDQMDTEAE